MNGQWTWKCPGNGNHTATNTNYMKDSKKWVRRFGVCVCLSEESIM